LRKMKDCRHKPQPPTNLSMIQSFPNPVALDTKWPLVSRGRKEGTLLIRFFFDLILSKRVSFVENLRDTIPSFTIGYVSSLNSKISPATSSSHQDHTDPEKNAHCQFAS
jgi:hypothetical protein